MLISALSVLTLLSAATQAAPAPLIVNLDVPELTAVGSVKGFEITSFQFNTYLTFSGDPSGSSDYAANVLGNDHEYYTYIYQPGCSGSGKGGGGGCHTPPPPERVSASTYSDTFTAVTKPPSEIDVKYVFSGADVAGLPLIFSVTDTGTYTLNLTDNTTNTAVALGAPLTSDTYTLEYITHDISGNAQVTVTAVPVPAALAMMLSGLLFITGLRRRPKNR